jgi:hypothetical protein
MTHALEIQPIASINIENKNIFVGAKFPQLNKLKTLAEYVAQLENFHPDKPVIERVKITEQITLSQADYNRFTSALTDDRDWLAGKGGHDSDYPTELEGMTLLSNSEEFCKWREKAYRICVLVVSDTDRRGILVDPQGYNYARYVGLINAKTLSEITEKIINE